jgi:hypothetical protein
VDDRSITRFLYDSTAKTVSFYGVSRSNPDRIRRSCDNFQTTAPPRFLFHNETTASAKTPSRNGGIPSGVVEGNVADAGPLGCFIIFVQMKTKCYRLVIFTRYCLRCDESALLINVLRVGEHFCGTFRFIFLFLTARAFEIRTYFTVSKERCAFHTFFLFLPLDE